MMELIQGDMHGLTLQDYLDLVEEIDRGGYELNDWEQVFIAGNLDAERLNERQREVILTMELKYLTKG